MTVARPADPQLASWWDDLETVRLEVRRLADELSPPQWLWQPAPGKWSIAECVDHLAVTGRAAGACQRAALEANRTRVGRGPFRFGLVGGWFVRMLGPDSKTKMPGPPVFAPGSDLDPVAVVAGFERAQDELQQLLVDSDGLDLGRIRARSAASPLVRLNLAAWYASNVAHERRHLGQIARLRAHAGFPTT